MSDLDALQTTLESEHAAVFVFAALAGRLRVDRAPRLASALEAAYAEHRGRRDELAGLIRDGGEQPLDAAPTYRLPTPLETVAQVRAAAVTAEAAASQAYAAQVSASSGESRSWGVSALTSSAVRQLTLGGAPTAFPGAPELG